MKLRLRSMDARAAAAAPETHRVLLPDAATLSDVKDFLAAKLSAAQPVPAESIRLTLNRSEELLSPVPAATLAALGIASGDLLFFTLNPLPSPSPPPPQTLARNPTPHALPAARSEGSTASSSSLPQAVCAVKPSLPAASAPHPPDVVMAEAVAATKSTPSFVVGALKREMVNAGGAEGVATLRLAVAMHAALLDSGFLAVNQAGSHLQLPLDSVSGASVPITVKYSIPEFIAMLDVDDGGKVAVLNYSVMGNYMMVYGHVPGAQSEVCRLCLELSRLAPLLYLDSDGVSGVEEEEILELWRVLKDELCLPLMISLCQLNNLRLPPCLMALPSDIKACLLEFVPGVDLAKVQCTCKELKDLVKDDNLWKKKCEMEFKVEGDASRMSKSWKERFGAAWAVKVATANKKSHKRLYPRFSNYGWGNDLYVPQVFPVIGGEQDRLPFIGHHSVHGRSFGNQHRNISPSCNLDGRRHNFLG